MSSMTALARELRIKVLFVYLVYVLCVYIFVGWGSDIIPLCTAISAEQHIKIYLEVVRGAVELTIGNGSLVRQLGGTM